MEQKNKDERLFEASVTSISGKIVVHHQGGRSGMMADHYDERDMFFIIKGTLSLQIIDDAYLRLDELVEPLQIY